MPTRGQLLHPLQLPHSPHLALTVPILIGLGFGVLTRATCLAVDDGPFPSRPHGRINLMFLGLVAAVLGALAPAALLTADYTAGVFLAIGVAQFHTARQIERDMLRALDRATAVPRGRAYIEGLAMMLETRNYLVMLTAMGVTGLALVAGALPASALGLAAAVLLPRIVRAGATVGSLARVQSAPVARRDQALLVGGREVIHQASPEELGAARRALGLRVLPRSLAARLTLAEPGQGQAIRHSLANRLGLRPAGISASEGRAQVLLPHSVLDPESGELLLLCFPQVWHPALAERAVRQTPLLESVARRPEDIGAGDEGDAR